MQAADNSTTNIDEKTGFGNYLVKQAYQIIVSTGGVIGGAYAGVVGAKRLLKDAVISAEHAVEWAKLPVISKLPGLKTAPSMKQLQFGGIIGAVIGSMASGLVLGYGHWKKVKQAQMQVDEITKNISDIEVFKATDPELKAENQRLWAELQKREHPGEKHEGTEKRDHASKHEHAASMVEKAGATKQANWQERAAEPAHAMTEASR